MEKNAQPSPTVNAENNSSASPAPNSVNPPTDHSRLPHAIIIGVILLLLLAGGAAGFYVFKPQIMSLVSKPIPTPSLPLRASPTPNLESTASWKTYTDTVNKFTFRYPPNWGYQTQNYFASILNKGIKQTSVNFGIYEDADVEGKKITPIIPPAYVVLDIITYSNEVGNDLKNYAKLDSKEAPNNLHWSEITVNGIPAKKIDHAYCQSGNCTDVLIPKGNLIIDFFVQNGDKNLNQILSTFKFTDTNSASSNNCIVGGCSGQICQDAHKEPIVSTCIYKDEYACYKTAKCEVQSNGTCGWTQTPTLISCIQNASKNSGGIY